MWAAEKGEVQIEGYVIYVLCTESHVNFNFKFNLFSACAYVDLESWDSFTCVLC